MNMNAKMFKYDQVELYNTYNKFISNDQAQIIIGSLFWHLEINVMSHTNR